MAIAILRPQNCLVLSPLKSQRNSNPSFTSSNPNYHHQDGTTSSGGRRRSPINRPANRGRSRVGESAKNLVMGQVKILKRGEMLSCDGGVGVTSVGAEDLVLRSTDRFGPDPDLMQKQVVITECKVPNGTTATYAGSAAFSASPPPSSVPLPSFLDKNGTATTNLRRLLRLGLD